MKTIKITLSVMLLLAFIGLSETYGQWATSGTNIYNTNTGNVGIGTSTPGYLLHVSKNMTSPSIRIHNAGGIGGAAFEMVDNNSSADWKFKATNAGGFKIRDHAAGLDVIQVEPGSIANALYIDINGDIAMSHNAPNGFGLNVLNYTTAKAAVQGLNQSGTSMYSNGMLGLLNGPAAGLPVYAWNVGVVGIRTSTPGGNGAGVFGWNTDANNSENYGGIFVADGAATTIDYTNYAVFGRAMHANKNLAGKFEGRVEIDGHPSATEAPDYAATVLKATVNHTISDDTRAVDGVSVPADGYGYGVYGTGGWRGVYGHGSGGTYTGTTIGVRGNATGSAGTRIGVYGTASGGTVANWAGYFDGDAYVSSDLRIATTSGATGYALSVNGKVACTEVLVEAFASWPDYVFADNYKLMSLEELEQSIEENNHLPGLPSAAEIEENGILLGDMQTKMMEKIEELTLYTISQGKMINAQGKVISELQEKMENLEKENTNLRRNRNK